MNIKTASDRSGVPAKTIRYYEEVGLVTPARSGNGYRTFTDRDVHDLTFLGRARALGFGLEECRTLLALWRDEGRASSEVKRIAKAHLENIDQRITDLRAMQATLSHLVDACAGDDRPDCPILDSLEPQEG
ncbi:MAG: Cu(I)-responsive transcriptional regulator [Pseudomonadota bacterium]